VVGLRFYDHPRPQSDGAADPGDAAWDQGTGHRFPREGADKLLYLEREGQEGKWEERKPRGFAEAKETLEQMLRERYLPCTQTLTHKRSYAVEVDRTHFCVVR